MVDISSNEISYADGTTPLRVYEVYARWDAIAQHSLTERDKLEINKGDTTIYANISGIRNQGIKDRVAIITVEEVLA